MCLTALRQLKQKLMNGKKIRGVTAQKNKTLKSEERTEDMEGKVRSQVI